MDRTIANDIVAFAETLYTVDRAWVPDGDGWRMVRKRPIHLQDWQKRQLWDVFPPSNGGRPVIRNYLDSENKKLGKSAKAGVVAAYMAATESNAEVYICASDKDQARDRVFKSIRYAVENGPLGDFATVYKDVITFSNGSTIQALPQNYKGAAGGEPVCVVFDELHTATLENENRLWDELVIPPTLPYGIRWVSSYAGWEGESNLLREIWDTVKAGRQVQDWPPIYHNDSAAWWGTIVQGERGYTLVPWTMGERGRKFLAEAKASERGVSYERLFLNEWAVNSQSYILPEWWDNCKEFLPVLEPGDKAPLVCGLDASVSGACTALVTVSHHPNNREATRVQFCHIWNPAQLGGEVVQSETVVPTLDYLARNFNLAACAYDEFQTAKLAQDIRRGSLGIALNMYKFDQGRKREISDTILRQMAAGRLISHDGNELLRQHIMNSRAKVTDERKLRIIKKASGRYYDGAVALSMANWLLHYYNL